MVVHEPAARGECERRQVRGMGSHEREGRVGKRTIIGPSESICNYVPHTSALTATIISPERVMSISTYGGLCAWLPIMVSQVVM